MRKQKLIKALIEDKQNAPLLTTDVIYRIVSKVSTPVLWWVIFAIYVAVYVTVGLMVNHIYPRVNPDTDNILRINDLAEIVNGINVWVIFWPAIWAYHRWFPEKVLMSFVLIEKRGIISPISDTLLSTILERRFVSKWVYIIATLATFISLAYLLLATIPMQEDALHGLIAFWYYTWWTKLFFLVLYAPANFILFAYIIRVLITVVTINHYFQHSSVIINLYPMHPDKCGGIGEIGYLISRTILIIVLVPTWATIYSFTITLAGGDSMLRPLGIVYLVYLILAPIILSLFLWRPHRAMEQFKNQQLDEISRELLWIKNSISEKINGATHNQDIKREMERYKQLQELYENLEKHIPVWPISFPALRSFGLFTSSPVILGFLSNILLDYLKKHYFGI